MMDESQIAEIWTTLKEYFDKKNLETAAERYVDLLADFGVSDETFQELLGTDEYLDDAIGYYLDIDTYEEYEDDEEY